MRIFAAIERILLDRWSKIKHNVGINKWPLLNRKEQQLQLKKQYLESLLDEKWHNFVKPIHVIAGTHSPPRGSLLLYITDLFWLVTVINIISLYLCCYLYAIYIN